MEAALAARAPAKELIFLSVGDTRDHRRMGKDPALRTISVDFLLNLLANLKKLRIGHYLILTTKTLCAKLQQELEVALVPDNAGRSRRAVGCSPRGGGVNRPAVVLEPGHLVVGVAARTWCCDVVPVALHFKVDEGRALEHVVKLLRCGRVDDKLLAGVVEAWQVAEHVGKVLPATKLV